MRRLKTRPHLTFSMLTLALAAAFGISHYLSRVGATALAPFIDLQEAGLTLVQDGEGLANWDLVTPANLTVNIGGSVRFALLYWNGRDRPCMFNGTTCTFTQPFKDQQVVFNGTAITGTIIGTETQPTTASGPTLNIGYFADVTSIVSAAGTGNKTFTFADGNAASNLTPLNGVTLFVAYTDAANPQVYRVIIWDGLDFAFGDDPTPGETRVTAPVTFNHGILPAARPAELYLVVGGGTPTRPDNVTISNNPPLFNTLDGSAGPDWDSDAYSINIPASVGTTTVQVNSAPAGSNPDELLWEVAALRVALDAPPACTQTVSNGPPFQVQHTIQDTDTGLAEIFVLKSNNADTVVPPFTVGTTAPVVATSTKIDQSQPMCVEIRTTDVAGNVSFCTYCEGLTISKTFGAASIQQGGTTSLSFTVNSLPSGGGPFNNVSFTDALPSGLIVATPNGLSGSCGGGTINALAGGGGITLSGATLAAGASCTFSANVTGTTTGNKPNTVMATANNGVVSNTATASLEVTTTASPVISKMFGAAAIPQSGTTSLSFTITNPMVNTSALTGVGFTDTLPSGLVVATPNGLSAACGGGITISATPGSGVVSLMGATLAANGSCTFSVNVQGTTPGVKSNSVTVTSTNGGTGNTATASVTVVALPSVAKSFAPAVINIGEVSQLTLTFTNPAGNVALSDLAVSDPLPAGLTLAATPGLVNTCGGMVAGATAGSSSLSLSGGALPLGASSCQVQVNVTSSSLGPVVNTTGNVMATGSGINVTGNAANATLNVSAVVSTPSITIVDPFGCTGPGDVLTVTVQITNPAVIAQPVTFAATLPAGLVGLGGTGTSTVGTAPTVTAGSASFGPTVLAAGQMATVSYQVQVGDAASGAQLCISTASRFSGAPGPAVQACATINCPPVGPGLPFPSSSEVSDQKAGSVLVYNLYSSSAAAPNSQNTRLSITNTSPGAAIAVHLFFVDGQTCSIADAIICLTQNQTATALASDLDPGTTGYLVAVATDPTTGCPVNFNFLIGDAYIKLTSGHQANLGAEAFAALAGGPVACDGNSLTAQLNFDGVSYNRAPRVLAASSLPARNDGNDTLLVINRFGGNLATGASTLTDLLGLFYDDTENALSFTFSPGTCQFRSSLSGNFPRTTPRLDSFIPAGRTGWLRLYSASDIGLLGAILNYNPTAGTSAGAFNQGRNLHKLTLGATQTLVIPIFPPNCLD